MSSLGAEGGHMAAGKLMSLRPNLSNSFYASGFQDMGTSTTYANTSRFDTAAGSLDKN